jgi:YjbE family integral membrane protein
LASIAGYFQPDLWRDWLSAAAAHLGYAAFWLAVGRIIFVNAVLSGDNAIVIAMACRGLPENQRRWGLLVGVGVAAALRIVFTAIIARLMTLPYLKLIGGAALLYIAAKLLVPDERDRNKIEAASHLSRVVTLVVVADIIMSFDNVVAIAAIAQGDFLLLVIGLAASIPLLVVGAALIAALLDRFPILVWGGAALLGWIAGETIVTDPALSQHLIAALGTTLAQQLEFAGSVSGAVLAIEAGGLWQCLHGLDVRARTGEREAVGE